MDYTIQVLSSDGKVLFSSKTENDQCYAKALLRGQDKFVLVEQDITAPRVLAFWAKLNCSNLENKLRLKKVVDALDRSYIWANSKTRKKLAD